MLMGRVKLPLDPELELFIESFASEHGLDEEDKSFLRRLFKYIKYGRYDRRFESRCRELGIINEDGKVYLDFDHPDVHLLVLCLVWKGLVEVVKR